MASFEKAITQHAMVRLLKHLSLADQARMPQLSKTIRHTVQSVHVGTVDTFKLNFRTILFAKDDWTGYLETIRPKMVHVKTLTVATEVPARSWPLLLQTFPNLTRLTFEGYACASTFPPSLWPLLFGTFKLQRLQAIGCSLPRGPLIQKMLHPFSHLRTLTMFAPAIDAMDLARFSVHKRITTLKITLHSPFPDHMYEQIAQLFPRLRILYLNGNVPLINSMSVFGKAYGPRLLEFVRTWWNGFTPIVLDANELDAFAACTHLRRMSMEPTVVVPEALDAKQTEKAKGLEFFFQTHPLLEHFSIRRQSLGFVLRCLAKYCPRFRRLECSQESSLDARDHLDEVIKSVRNLPLLEACQVNTRDQRELKIMAAIHGLREAKIAIMSLVGGAVFDPFQRWLCLRALTVEVHADVMDHDDVVKAIIVSPELRFLSLDFRACHQVEDSSQCLLRKSMSDEGLRHIASTCPLLTTLELNHWFGPDEVIPNMTITSLGVKSMLSRCRDLACLNFHYCLPYWWGPDVAPEIRAAFPERNVIVH
jgi:hypothetical protein